MANLDLTGSPHRPTIDGIISNDYFENLYGWTGTEYEGFTEIKMYISGQNPSTQPDVATAYVAYGENTAFVVDSARC